MKALEVLKKCKNRLEEMTQEEFDSIVLKRKLDKIDYNYEQYLNNDFEIILPTENCVNRLEVVKEVVGYTTKNSSLNEYKNLYTSYKDIFNEYKSLYSSYKDIFEERKNNNIIYESYIETNLSEFLNTNSYIYDNEEIIDSNVSYKSNPPCREFAWNDMEQGDSLVKAA